MLQIVHSTYIWIYAKNFPKQTKLIKQIAKFNHVSNCQEKPHNCNCLEKKIMDAQCDIKTEPN